MNKTGLVNGNGTAGILDVFNETSTEVKQYITITIMTMVTGFITSFSANIKDFISKNVSKIWKFLFKLPESFTKQRYTVETVVGYTKDRDNCVNVSWNHDVKDLHTLIDKYIYCHPDQVIRPLEYQYDSSYARFQNIKNSKGSDAEQQVIIKYNCILIDDITIKIDNELETKDVKFSNENPELYITYTFKSDKSVKHIEDFLVKCKKFNDSLKDPEKVTQYFFNSTSSPYKFEYYDFYSKVSFDDVFLPEKDLIIDAIEKLQKGELSKLVILLYGAPGLGKSSLVKSTANYTGKHLINVRLSDIKSDKEFMDLFHNPDIKSSDGDYTDIPISKRIYVIEDIDAESDVVLRRDLPRQNIPKKKKNKIYIPRKKSSDSDDDSDDNPYDSIDDSLTLSGILNTFDGLLELDHPIIFISANHPEKLDPALIRSGRVDYRIGLQNAVYPYITDLIEKELGSVDHSTVKKYIKDLQYSPAQLREFIRLSSKDVEKFYKVIQDPPKHDF